MKEQRTQGKTESRREREERREREKLTKHSCVAMLLFSLGARYPA
jgi:hypothetical protein